MSEKSASPARNAVTWLAVMARCGKMACLRVLESGEARRDAALATPMVSPLTVHESVDEIAECIWFHALNLRPTIDDFSLR